jgi:hypothetical protein
MNYLVYPTKVMNVTQNHFEGNHANHSNGTPFDYPFDEACESTGRSWFYCPCDEVKIAKVYTAGVNTVWMESTKPVIMPIGTANVTIMVEHMNDDDMRTLSVGKIFRRGEKMFREGKDGATGNHFHISVALGKMKGGGWQKNDKGSWAISATDTPIGAAEAFYIDDTKIVNSKGYKFKQKPKEEKNMEKLDNTPDKYAEEIIKRARKDGVLRGDDEGNEKLHSEITRQDALVFIYRAIDANK